MMNIFFRENMLERILLSQVALNPWQALEVVNLGIGLLTTKVKYE
jgi:hypothetical protein